MPFASAGGPRALLRRLREIMTEPLAPQHKLDRIATVIAANMVAEVCSIYLARSEGELELFATEGLNPNAVHRTRLKKGEGLVGDVAAHARPLNLADAPLHPQFSYRPETGEDPFHSFLGVPVMRSGRTLGVLTVQNKIVRHYEEEEVEALQTVAMVLAEMIAAGDLVDPSDLGDGALKRTGPARMHGQAISEGVAIGRAVLHEPRVRVQRLIAENTLKERERLDAAIDAMRESVDRLIHEEDIATGETRDILETYRMFAHDKGWLARLREAVTSGLTAEAAVERVQNDTRARLLRAADPYIRERLHDLDDLANRLMRQLAGSAAVTLPEDAIIVARSMGPADLLEYDRTRVRGLILEDASPASHVAIVARALGIPAVSGGDGFTDVIEADDIVIADGDAGEYHVRPGAEIIGAYREKLAIRAQRAAEYASLKHEPSVTRDGIAVALMMNAGLVVDLPHLAETGAHGIGLFRTELPFMISPAMPRFSEQSALYTRVMDDAGGRPVYFRTLDLGGDKLLPYAKLNAEENPALGWRAIRIGLDRPALLRYQIRALLAAGTGRTVHIMFPMIADVAEFDAARVLVDKEIERLRRLSKALPRAVKVGTMLEVPALAFQLPALLRRTDFISVGSNDLMQFLFASDRGNPRMANRYDSLSPACLRFLRRIVTEAEAAGVPVSLCGEMASRPLEAMALIGLGFRALSMPPAAIGPVKKMLRSLPARALQAYLEEIYDRPERSLRAWLKAFAAREGVAL